MRHVIKGPKVTWVDILNPTQEDVKYLREKFSFHPLVLDEIIPPGHRTKVEHYPGYLFMILYYPVYSKEKRETRPREIDIIVTKNTVITSHYRSILPLKALFDKCNLYKQEAGKKYLSEDAGYLLFHILDGFWRACLQKLVPIDRHISEIEKEIFRGKEKEMVSEISLVKTDIINLWRIIGHQEKTLRSLAQEGERFFGPALKPYFSEILGTYTQALDSLETYKEAVLALENTNQSMLSTKTNEIMKTLTVFSVIILPLTLLASILSMNILIPFAASPYLFFATLGVMAIALIFMFAYFKRKRWF